MSKIKLTKKWEVLLIHHTHTDIGYTQSQEVIEFYHVNFIKQVIEILEGLRVQGKEKDFKWVCEAFWGVETFLRRVDESWRKRFETCVKNGGIELTGSYLNMTELIDDQVLKNQIKKSVDYGKSIEKEVRCAMTADINGYSWGFVDALAENGIENLLSCVHTHHGMYPLFRKLMPFYWESEKGNKVLVWNGEHYHFGNEFGIVKTATGSYVHKDELRDSFTQDKLKEYGHKRMYRYLKSLEDQAYEYNFVPITVHGLPTDNSSANLEVLEFVQWWNENFSHEVIIKMSTLEELFDRVRASEVEIQTYRGDWPDWWAFGVGSTPNAVKVYKEAQRLLQMTKMIDENLCDNKLVNECEEMLMLYAEHTWGHSASITNPWNSLVNLMDYKKSSYAARAHELAIRNYLNVLEARGMTSLKPNREPKFKVINPHSRTVTECVKLFLDYWETSNLINVVVDDLGNEYATQIERHPRGEAIHFIATLEANEERTFWVERREHPVHYIKIKNESACVQGYDDIFLYEDKRAVIKYDQTYENGHVRISWNKQHGIISWYDKVNQVELLDPSSETGAFMPIYECSKAYSQTTSDQYSVRSRLGRNMRGANHEVYYAHIKQITINEIGEIYGKIQLDLELEGTTLAKVELKIYHDICKVEVQVILNKMSVWNPESLYVALPFAYNQQKMDLFAEKTGCTVQLKKDQLLGTNCDYYLVQEGVGLKKGSYGMSIAMPDTPLIYTSPLRYENAKKLYHPKYTKATDYELYSWPMNNLWETNFKVSLAGFIELNYAVSWSNQIESKQDLTRRNHEMNMGFLNYRID